MPRTHRLGCSGNDSVVMGGRAIAWNDEWLIENIDNYPSYTALQKEYNDQFGTNACLAAFKNHCRLKLGLQKKRQNYRLFTEEQIHFLKEHYPKLGSRKTVELFNEKFNENRTISSMKNFGRKYGITVHDEVATANKTEAAHAPGSKRAKRSVGDTRMECGRLVMKTENGWMGASRAVYEAEHGSIPKGYAVKALDGDCNNIDKDNLVAVPWSYLGLLQKYGLQSTEPEITKVGIAWCRLYELVKDEVKLSL